MLKTKLIKDINSDDDSTWLDSIFLTIDVDWASDPVIEFTIELLNRYNLSATWFITHETDLISLLRSNPKFELGIHPNFNFLMNGDFRNGKNAFDVVERLMNIVPESKSVRSHSMTQSSVVLDLFKSFGLEYDCNHFIPFESGICLKPWRHWNGIQKVPYGWEDDVFMLDYAALDALDITHRNGLKVFDFHPIHLFLNTETIARYESAKPYLQNYPDLIKFKNNAEIGTLCQFNKLVSHCGEERS